ncbi:MAG: redoxin domain-containing protein [Clostridia bacterium]|nr:redoxin domain-containing protein [Clostridia bacterium]
MFQYVLANYTFYSNYSTPVCTTEFISFAKYYPEFMRRNTYLLGLSVDSIPSNLAWVYNIYRNTGIQIPFPIISDRDMKVSKAFSMISDNSDNFHNIRNVYIIDPNQKIRAILQYPPTTGRNIAEILRILEALQLTDQDNVATPANWLPGQPVILPYPQTYDELIERAKNPAGYNCVDWYLCFKQELPTQKNMVNIPNFPQVECTNAYSFNQPVNMMV